MKRILMAAVLAVSSMLAMTAALAAQSYKLAVDGLACPFCAYGIERKLNAVEGVGKVDVDIASGIVTVTMAEGATLDQATARNAVKEAGFSLGSFEPAAAASPGKPKAKQ